MQLRNLNAPFLLLVLGVMPPVVIAQRSPAAPTPTEIRAGITRLEAQRTQLKDQATRMDAERRELEQQLDRVRRDQQVLDQRVASIDLQIRQLEQSLLQAR